MSLIQTTAIAAVGATLALGIKKYTDGCKVELLASSDDDEKFMTKVYGTTEHKGHANLGSFIGEHCSKLSSEEAESMVPTPYLCGGMLQTVYCTSIGLKKDSLSRVIYDRELVTMSDNGTISIDWYPKRAELPSKKPIAVIMPGLGGSSYEYHIRRLAKVLGEGENGYQVAIMNHRGSGRTPLTSGRIYNGYDTEDFGDIVKHIAAANPGTPLVAMGYSLGANLLTKYLGEQGDASLFTAAVAICCPFDTEIAGRSLDARNFLNDKLFQPNLVATIKRVISRNLAVIKTSKVEYDIDSIMKAKRMSELDNLITAKTYGHQDCWAYYRAASSTRYVDTIRTPFLAINSLDDPITPHEGIPYEKFKTNPFLALAVTKHGGHLGFFTGMSPRIWYLDPVKQFFDSLLLAKEC
ncbi:hypothetical protein GGI07_002830 [Coemansia sp. Benny D115]|nr:hypothetical protein GGI07_002830 [Coemansia sp. Benny D115]